MDPFVSEIFEAFKAAYVAGGWVALGGTAVMMSVRIYRLAIVQGVVAKFAPKAQWHLLPTWAKWSSPFVAAGLGSFILAWTGSGIGGVQAAVMAGIAAVISIVGNAGTKQAGVMKASFAYGKNPAYVPKARPVSGLIFPVPSEKTLQEIKHKKGLSPG